MSETGSNVTRYLPGGEVRKIAEPSDVETFGVKPVRASRVEPVLWYLRIPFLLLRKCFGDSGEVADWTRRWRCRFRVRTLIAYPEILGPFDTREEALRAEVAWIEKNWILAK